MQTIQTIRLGRTGLQATIAGLGCGGHSRIGLAKYGEEHAASIVRAAYDSGLNFFDTAEAYGTEAAVGRGLDGIDRSSYILSTKFTYRNAQRNLKTESELNASLEKSLRSLRVDYVDIYHIHAASAADYPALGDTIIPFLQKAKEQGRIRFLGITEMFGSDTSHEMFQLALPQNLFDVIMVGYNLLNPSAARTVLPITLEKDIGVLCMFAVRSALSNPAQLKIDIRRILDHGQAEELSADEDLSFLTDNGYAASIMEAAYRYCSHTPGIDIVLTGTGSRDHLIQNIASIQMPKLPAEALERLERLFGGVDCVSGQ